MPKILVVDNSKLMRSILGAQLREVGYEVEEIEPKSLSDLMHHIKTAKFDAVITDYEMPVFSGEQLVRAINGNLGLDSIRVLMLTSHHESDLATRMDGLHVDAFLTKPLVMEQVLTTLRDLLGA